VRCRSGGPGWIWREERKQDVNDVQWPELERQRTNGREQQRHWFSPWWSRTRLFDQQRSEKDVTWVGRMGKQSQQGSPRDVVAFLDGCSSLGQIRGGAPPSMSSVPAKPSSSNLLGPVSRSFSSRDPSPSPKALLTTSVLLTPKRC
jgi:hypothetical protein